MITLTDLTRKYIKLYTAVRQYIWPFETVEDLGALEIAVYNRFPDMDDVIRKFDTFYRDIELECKDDEDLKKAVEEFRNVIESNDTVYSNLMKVQEVQDYEDTEIKV